MEIDTLVKYGHSYQAKVITSVITDRAFLEQIYDILLEDFFESEANQWIVNRIKKYFNTYRELPTLEIFKSELDEEENELLKVDIIEKLKEIWSYRNSTELKYIKDKFLTFCKNQKLKQAMYESIEELKKGNYEAIKQKFDEAFKAGTDRNIGLILTKEEVNNVFTVLKRNTIETPWTVINDITQGGLAPGELGIVVGGPGSGKSWTLSSLGLAAALSGKNVVHYTLELSEGAIAQRYYSILTGIAAHALPYNIDEIKHKLQNIINKKSNLIIKNYPTKTASLNTLRAHMEQTIAIEGKPDFAIIDYGDLLKPLGFYREKRLEIGNIYEDIRGFAGEYGMPTWTGSQANRTAAEGSIIVGEQVSEDYSKIMIGDFIMSIHRKVEDKVSKTARVHIIKNRFGPDGLTYPSKFNADNGHMSIFEEQSLQGQQTKKDMGENGTNLKKILKDKYFSDTK